MNIGTKEWLRESLQHRDRVNEGIKEFLDIVRAETTEALKENSGWIDPYMSCLDVVVNENVNEVFRSSGSPIETIFLNALVLGFLKVDSLGLAVQPFRKDAETERSEFLAYYQKFNEFLEWQKTEFSTYQELTEFLDEEDRLGKMAPGERSQMTHMLFRYHWLRMGDSYHMTLQPPFPGININGKSIRPDIYFWVPNSPELKVIVECDGFDYHSDREKFSADRKRDRALQAKGFQVLRYSGTEIFHDPIGVTGDLMGHLRGLQDDQAW